MKRFKKQSLILAVAFALVLNSCAKHKDEPAPVAPDHQPLSSDQRKNLHFTKVAVDNVESSIPENKSANLEFLNIETGPGGDLSDEGRLAQVQDVFKGYRSGNRCQVDALKPVTPDPMNNHLVINMGGHDCPIDFRMDYKVTTDNSMHKVVTVDAQFDSRDNFLNRINGVSKYALKGTILDQTLEKMTSDMSGTITSERFGAIKIAMTGSAQANADGMYVGEFNVRYEYPDFVAALKMTMDGKGEPNFYLNAEKITEQEFLSFIPSRMTQSDSKTMLFVKSE